MALKPWRLASVHANQLLICLLALGALSPCAHAVDRSVAGIETGMTLDEVKAKLPAGYKQATVGTNEAGTFIETAASPDQLDLIAAMFVDNKVDYIYRQTHVAANAGIPYDNLQGRLTDKFGAHSGEIGAGKNDFGWTWEFDRAGQLRHNDRCVLINRGALFVRLGSQPVNIKAPRSASASCGFSVFAQAVGDLNFPTLVTYYTLSVFDEPALFKHLEAQHAQQQGEHNGKVDAAKSRQPSL